MSAQIDTIRRAIPFLSKSEQKELFLYLAHLIGGQEEANNPDDAFKLTPEWEAELDRRFKLLKEGKTTLHTSEEVLAKMGL